MKRSVVLAWSVSVATACGGKILGTAPDGSAGAVLQLPAECKSASSPPQTIECTGLYADVATKQLAPDVREYTPAVVLWADGNDKERWIALPQGTKIDATDPNEWVFPVGTRVFKQFSRDGKRVETRMFQKTQPHFWVYGTYLWNDDESGATLSAGGDIPRGADGGTYHVPTPDECDQCHRGRSDRVLGFEQVALGLPGASGVTLAQLVAEDLIAPAPARTQLVVGDDGTGYAPAPLAWLHINCGTTCHNANANSTGYGAGMRLRLDPTLLDGRNSAGFDSRTTTIGVKVNAPTWYGQTRIVPGDPSSSLLFQLISHRGKGQQMPPIATDVADEPDDVAVALWIGAMQP
jgi:hypothetical protein